MARAFCGAATTEEASKEESAEGTVAPIRDEGQRFPQLGVSPPYQLTLSSGGNVSERADR